MRCARVNELADRFADGILQPDVAAAVEAHAAGCPRCAARVADARRLAGLLGSQPAPRAPVGFTGRVMDAVYRAALAGAPEERAVPDSGEGAAARRPGLTAVYRRLGVSFVLAAAVLVAGLVLPQGMYPLRTASVAAGISRDSSSMVKDALEGAGRSVQSALGKGGTTR